MAAARCGHYRLLQLRLHRGHLGAVYPPPAATAHRKCRPRSRRAAVPTGRAAVPAGRAAIPTGRAGQHAHAHDGSRRAGRARPEGAATAARRASRARAGANRSAADSNGAWWRAATAAAAARHDATDAPHALARWSHRAASTSTPAAGAAASATGSAAPVGRRWHVLRCRVAAGSASSSSAAARGPTGQRYTSPADRQRRRRPVRVHACAGHVNKGAGWATDQRRRASAGSP